MKCFFYRLSCKRRSPGSQTYSIPSEERPNQTRRKNFQIKFEEPPLRRRIHVLYTDMQENMWARLRVSPYGTHTIHAT